MEMANGNVFPGDSSGSSSLTLLYSTLLRVPQDLQVIFFLQSCEHFLIHSEVFLSSLVGCVSYSVVWIVSEIIHKLTRITHLIFTQIPLCIKQVAGFLNQ